MGAMKLTRTPIKALAAVGASAAVIASGSAAYAIYGATAAPSASGPVAQSQLAAAGVKANASAGAKPPSRAAARRALGGLVIGEITSISSTGGAASAGTISVRVPDGKTVTANLAKRTRIYAYHGPGDKPTAEPVSKLGQNEMVAVRILTRPATGSGTTTGAAAAGSAQVLTAATATATGTPYAALILDLGYTASS